MRVMGRAIGWAICGSIGMFWEVVCVEDRVIRCFFGKGL